MEQQIKCAVFDLDGTLINTITDLGNACDFLIGKYGFCAHWSEDDYKRFVGNGNRKLVERGKQVLEEFFEYYNEHSLDNTKAYDGIKEQLELLKEKGIKLAVVTNKNEPAAIHIVEYIFGKGTFDVIIGQRDGLPVKPAPDGVYLALEEMECTKEEALYFGDSNVDIMTAKNAGVEVVGVTWGFRSFEELFAEGPDIIIDEPKYISSLF